MLFIHVHDGAKTKTVTVGSPSPKRSAKPSTLEPAAPQVVVPKSDPVPVAVVPEVKPEPEAQANQ